jgi:hypothetical protein
MNQSKFTLADVLTLLTALVFGFVCFLGANFYTLGNITQSIVLAVIITVLLWATAFGAKLLKRTKGNFKTSFVWEIILLVVFTGLLVFFAFSPFPHYFNVSANKAEIKSNLMTSITLAENMFTEYESYAENRKYLYENKLKSVVNAKNINPGEFKKYGFEEDNGVSNEKEIENKMFTVHAVLFPSNYSDTVANNGIKEAAAEWLAHAKSTVNSWNPIGTVNIVNDVEKYSTKWLNELIELSKQRQQGEQAEDFAYNLSFDDTKMYFTTPGKPTGISVGLAVVAWGLMLLSWLVTKRDSRSTGALTTAPYEVVL